MVGGGLVRRNVTIALGTAASRVTGLARVVMIGIALGGGELADAYVSSNNAPNAVYELLVGGVLSAGVVPLFTDLRVHGRQRSINAVITVGALASFVLALLAILAAPLVFRVLTLNAADSIDVEAFRSVGTLLSRMLLAQIFFYGLIALTSALLNAQRRFAAAAWSPVLANLVTIAGFVVLFVRRPVDGWSIDDVQSGSLLRLTLGGAATLGIAASAVVLVVAARGSDHRYAWNLDLRDQAVGRLVRLSTWTFGYVAVNQIALIVIQNLTEPGSGGRFAYAQAFTFFVLPHGLIAVSIATSLSPEMSEAYAVRAERRFSRVLGLGLRFTMLLTVPAGVGLFVLRQPLVSALLGHGELQADQVDLIADTLGAFALGLPAFSVYLFVLRGFYARLDTRTPFVINSVECALNVVIGLLLVGRYGVVGLAASFSIAYACAAVIAIVVLLARTDGFDRTAASSSLVRATAGATVVAVVVWSIGSAFGSTRGLGAALHLTVGVLVGVGVYVGVIRALRDPDLDELIAVITRRATRRT